MLDRWENLNNEFSYINDETEVAGPDLDESARNRAPSIFLVAMGCSPTIHILQGPKARSQGNIRHGIALGWKSNNICTPFPFGIKDMRLPKYMYSIPFRNQLQKSVYIHMYFGHPIYYVPYVPKERIFPKMVLKLLLHGPRSNSELAAWLHVNPAPPLAILKRHSSWQNKTLCLSPRCAVPSPHLHSALFIMNISKYMASLIIALIKIVIRHSYVPGDCRDIAESLFDVQMSTR